jgi:hypothetical protein
MDKTREASPEAFEARVAAVGRQLGDFGQVPEAEVHALSARVTARLEARPRARLAWALAGGLLGVLALTSALVLGERPADAEGDPDDPVLVLMEEVADIAYPRQTARDEDPYEDALAGAVDWLVKGEVDENGAEEFPPAFAWLDAVLSDELDSELL